MRVCCDWAVRATITHDSQISAERAKNRTVTIQIFPREPTKEP